MLLVVVVSKFTEGAWIPAVVIPIDRPARSCRSAATTPRVREAIYVPPATSEPSGTRHTVVVLVGSVNRGVLDAITYARSLAPDRLIARAPSCSDEPSRSAISQASGTSSTIAVELHTSTRLTAS